MNVRFFVLFVVLLIPRLAFAQAAVTVYCGSSPQTAGACGPTNPLSTYNQSYNQLAVTPSDSVALAPPAGFPTTALPKAIFNGNGATECAIAVKSAAPSATTVTFSNVQPGEILPISPAYVMATGTTCTGIDALY